MEFLEYIRCKIYSYLGDRVLIYHSEDGPKTNKIKEGVPLSSVLDHLLWNVMYDAVLKLSMPIDKKTYKTEAVLVTSRKVVESITVGGILTVAWWYI